MILFAWFFFLLFDQHYLRFNTAETFQKKKTPESGADILWHFNEKFIYQW